MPTPFETKKRSVAKTVTWKVIATSITLLTVYAFTGNLIWSAKITIAAAVMGMVSFYIHERIWNQIGWGKMDQKRF